KKNHTSTILLVVAGVLVLVGAILIGSKFIGGDDKASDKIAAPSYVGKTFAEAKLMAQNNGDFDLKRVSEPCKDQPAKKVCK
ncbi:serine/threonine protein kinase, partial [Streptomyces sp. SID11233]|nr:serine/threonine protein kinase [Streptomyces sp. SID11233]